jgi:hypothetical protein
MGMVSCQLTHLGLFFPFPLGLIVRRTGQWEPGISLLSRALLSNLIENRAFLNFAQHPTE